MKKHTLPILAIVLIAIVAAGCATQARVPSASSSPEVTSVTPESHDPIQLTTFTGPDGQMWTVPTSIDVWNFPLMGGKMSEREAFLLKLRKARLSQDGYYFNENRKTKRLDEIDRLPAGTEVWASADGTARYKADCNNRIDLATAVVNKPPAAKTKPVPTPVPGGGSQAPSPDTGSGRVNPKGGDSSSSKTTTPGLFAGLGELLRNLFQGLLPLLLLALLIALIAALAAWAFRQLRPAPPAPPVLPPNVMMRRGPERRGAVDRRRGGDRRAQGGRGGAQAPPRAA